MYWPQNSCTSCGMMDGKHSICCLSPNRKKEVEPVGLLPTDADERKQVPLGTLLLEYFPRGFVELAKLAYAGNQQHNPGEPTHWNRSKSVDHADCIMRHFMEQGRIDKDGQRHTAKLAIRALMLLEIELENASGN